MGVQGEFVVRRATNHDLEAAARLWRESALSMDHRPDVPSAQALCKRIDMELQSGWDLHVAARGARIIGLLALKPAEATLDQIFVLPAEQRKGIGAALIAVARSEMPSGFTLRVAAANGRARRFYEKEGLAPAREGVHPWTGVPVHFYEWPGY